MAGRCAGRSRAGTGFSEALGHGHRRHRDVFLVLTFFATFVDERGAFKAIAGFGIGLSITMGILVAGPFTGGAMNPSRAFGPAVAIGHWLSQGVYWIGPLAGGFFAGLLYDGVFLKKGSVIR